MTTPPAYDRLGLGYSRGRRPDPRIVARIDAALGDARTVLNVGAGTGSYEPGDRAVVALEPSNVMIGQRTLDAAPVIRGVAEQLPFRDRAFDAALAVLTVHHWNDHVSGLAEIRRVARRQIVFTWDPEALSRFWFTRDYLVEAIDLDDGFITLAPTLALLARARVEVVPVPHDCRDGFFAAYWRRPEAYFDPAVRAGISGFKILDPDLVERSLGRLRADLDSGTWHERNAELLELDELDLGYRLIVAGE